MTSRISSGATGRRSRNRREKGVGCLVLGLDIQSSTPNAHGCFPQRICTMGSIRRAIIVIAETNLLSNAKTRLFSSQPESGGAGSAPISLIETVSEMQKTQTAEVVLALPKGGRFFFGRGVFQWDSEDIVFRQGCWRKARQSVGGCMEITLSTLHSNHMQRKTASRISRRNF